MRLVVDATAWRDLNDIGTWIARDNAKAAARLLERILQAIAQLQHFPRLARPGRVRGTYDALYRRLRAVGEAGSRRYHGRRARSAQSLVSPRALLVAQLSPAVVWTAASCAGIFRE